MLFHVSTLIIDHHIDSECINRSLAFHRQRIASINYQLDLISASKFSICSATLWPRLKSEIYSAFALQAASPAAKWKFIQIERDDSYTQASEESKSAVV